MKWQFVFNSNLMDGLYGHIDELIALVKPTGYKFFIHNGDVYYIDGSNTGIKTTELI